VLGRWLGRMDLIEQVQMIIALVVINIVLQVLDGVSTFKALKHIQTMEGNRLARELTARLGVIPALLVLKGLGVTLTIAVGSLSIGFLALIIFACVNTWVVYDNFRIARKYAAEIEPSSPSRR
jgi:hypothetical protein